MKDEKATTRVVHFVLARNFSFRFLFVLCFCDREKMSSGLTYIMRHGENCENFQIVHRITLSRECGVAGKSASEDLSFRLGKCHKRPENLLHILADLCNSLLLAREMRRRF